MGNPMRLELTCEGSLVKLTNHYTTQGAHVELFLGFINFSY